MKFRVRLDLNDDNLSQVELAVARQTLFEWFAIISKECIVVHHRLPHGNPHYHIYFEAIECNSLDAMRMRIKRQFRPQNRSDYSVKKCDDGREDEFIQYLYNTKHGNIPTYIADYNIGASRIAKCMALAQEISTNFEATRKSKKQSGPTQYDMSDEVYELIVQKYGKDKTVFQRMIEEDKESFNPWTHMVEADLYEDCVRFAIQVCRKHRKGFDHYSLRKIVHPAYIRFSHCEKQFVASMVQNFFRE